MVLPVSTVPWRATAPVRARIASSSVVLPLWNGPTSATQRGPTARAPLPPFAAIVTSRTRPRRRTIIRRSRGELLLDQRGIVSVVAGGGQEAGHGGGTWGGRVGGCPRPP